MDPLPVIRACCSAGRAFRGLQRGLPCTWLGRILPHKLFFDLTGLCLMLKDFSHLDVALMLKGAWYGRNTITGTDLSREDS